MVACYIMQTFKFMVYSSLLLTVIFVDGQGWHFSVDELYYFFESCSNCCCCVPPTIFGGVFVYLDCVPNGTCATNGPGIRTQ